jgi:hypothetical protein
MSLTSNLTRDRRAAYRHNLEIPLRYRIRRRSATEYVSQSTNVSDLGIAFTTDQDLSIGVIVDLWVEMPKGINGASGSDWLCTGHVVRIERNEVSHLRRISVQFDCYEVLRPAEKRAEPIAILTTGI